MYKYLISQSKLNQAFRTNFQIDNIYRTVPCQHSAIDQQYIRIMNHRHTSHVRTAGVVGFFAVAGVAICGGSKYVTGADFTLCGNSNGIDGFRYE